MLGPGGAAARALRRGAALAAAPAPLLGSGRAVTADTQPAGAGSAAPAAGMNRRRPAAGTEAAVPRYRPCAGRAGPGSRPQQVQGPPPLARGTRLSLRGRGSARSRPRSAEAGREGTGKGREGKGWQAWLGSRRGRTEVNPRSAPARPARRSRLPARRPPRSRRPPPSLRREPQGE